MSMFDKQALIVGGSVTVALSALRRYQYNLQDYSAWCLVGGVLAAEAARAEKKLPESVRNALEFGSGYGISGADVITMLGGAVALEMSYDGAIQLGELTQMSPLSRMAAGALVAYGAKYIALNYLS